MSSDLSIDGLSAARKMFARDTRTVDEIVVGDGERNRLRDAGAQRDELASSETSVLRSRREQRVLTLSFPPNIKPSDA